MYKNCAMISVFGLFLSFAYIVIESNKIYLHNKHSQLITNLLLSDFRICRIKKTQTITLQHNRIYFVFFVCSIFRKVFFSVFYWDNVRLEGGASTIDSITKFIFFYSLLNMMIDDLLIFYFGWTPWLSHRLSISLFNA